MTQGEGAVPLGKLSAAAELAEAADRLAAVHLSDDEDDVVPSPALPTKPKEEENPELWKPHPPTVECPVCLVPLPLQIDQANYWTCCGKTVCQACIAETKRALHITNRERKDKELPPMGPTCAFCREPVPEDDSELIERYEKRIDNQGDTGAMVSLALFYRNGEFGLARDEAKTSELYQRAAGLGCAKAIANIGAFFFMGQLGVTQDKERGVAYWKDAAKKGDVNARFCLGEIEEHFQQHDLAMKHFKLAAAAGYEDATKRLWKYFPWKN